MTFPRNPNTRALDFAAFDLLEPIAHRAAIIELKQNGTPEEIQVTVQHCIAKKRENQAFLVQYNRQADAEIAAAQQRLDSLTTQIATDISKDLTKKNKSCSIS